jgi:hypothetical protein
MLCDQCCAHMHREISMLEGKTVNLMAYGCDGGKCDYRLRERLDEYAHKQIQKWREERFKNNVP